MNQIQYYTKNVYGNETLYIADAKQALQWRNLTGRKTITAGDMRNMSALAGTEFVRVFEPSTLVAA